MPFYLSKPTLEEAGCNCPDGNCELNDNFDTPATKEECLSYAKLRTFPHSITGPATNLSIVEFENDDWPPGVMKPRIGISGCGGLGVVQLVGVMEPGVGISVCGCPIAGDIPTGVLQNEQVEIVILGRCLQDASLSSHPTGLSTRRRLNGCSSGTEAATPRAYMRSQSCKGRNTNGMRRWSAGMQW